MSLLYMDFRKAYDSVSHNGILIKLGISWKTVALALNLLIVLLCVFMPKNPIQNSLIHSHMYTRVVLCVICWLLHVAMY